MVSQQSAKASIMIVIGFFLAVLLGGELLPTAFNSWFGANQSNWDGSTITLWDLTPLFAVVGVILFFVGRALDVF